MIHQHHQIHVNHHIHKNHHFFRIARIVKFVKKSLKKNLRQPFENSKMTVTPLMWPWHAMINVKKLTRWSSQPIASELKTLKNVCIRAKRNLKEPVAKFDIDPWFFPFPLLYFIGYHLTQGVSGNCRAWIQCSLPSSSSLSAPRRTEPTTSSDRGI